MNSTLARPVMALPNDQDHTGRDLGQAEIDLLKEVIATGTLTSTKGTFLSVASTIRFGQISDSVKRPRSGRQWSMKRRQNSGLSSGMN